MLRKKALCLFKIHRQVEADLVADAVVEAAADKWPRVVKVKAVLAVKVAVALVDKVEVRVDRAKVLDWRSRDKDPVDKVPVKAAVDKAQVDREVKALERVVWLKVKALVVKVLVAKAPEHNVVWRKVKDRMDNDPADRDLVGKAPVANVQVALVLVLLDQAVDSLTVPWCDSVNG